MRTTKIKLLSEADLHRARIEILRELTGHEVVPDTPEPAPATSLPRPDLLRAVSAVAALRG